MRSHDVIIILNLHCLFVAILKCDMMHTKVIIEAKMLSYELCTDSSVQIQIL